MWDPYAEFETTVLPNGLTVYTSHWPNREWEAMGIIVHAGGRQDPIGKEGTAHFVEHLVLTGMGVGQFQAMRRVADQKNWEISWGETDGESIKYRSFTPANPRTIKSLLNLGERLFSREQLAFANEVERERKIVLNEFLRAYGHSKTYQARLRILRAMLPAHHWQTRTLSCLGTHDSILRISHEDLEQWYHQYYVGSNISIVAVGGMDPGKLQQLIGESALAQLPTGTRAGLPRRVLKTKSKTLREVVPTKKPDCDYYTYSVLPATVSWPTSEILKRMLNELVFNDVREKRGITYSIGAWKGDSWDLTRIGISAETVPKNRLEELEVRVNSCVAQLPASRSTFERIRARVIAGISLSDVSGSMVRNGVLSDLGLCQRIITKTEELEDIRRVTLEDVITASEYFAPERRCTLLSPP